MQEARVRISWSWSRLKRSSRKGPVATESACSARPTVRVATRFEWPEVVGSRDSMAVTEASTKELKRWRMSWMRSVFSKATAAWLVRELTSSSSTEVKGMTASSTTDTGRSTILGSRFLLMSWTTPITLCSWSRMGTTSMERVR